MIFERDCIEQWQEFDDFFHDNPHIAEVSGFMTVLNNNPIGFVSWNPVLSNQRRTIEGKKIECSLKWQIWMPRILCMMSYTQIMTG